MRDDILRVQGDRILRDGEPFALHGVGIGGVLNMENYVVGYPGTESQMKKKLLGVIGQEAFTAFFDSFEESFFGPADARFLRETGIDSIRIPIHYRLFEDDLRPFELKESGFRRLDRIIGAASAEGLYSIIDLHSLPGAQNQHWHSDNPTYWAHFWSQRQFQDRVVHLWEALADRYKDDPWVAGYNPVNEPADESGTAVEPFYRRLESAVRAIDPDHILFLDGNTFSTDFSGFHEPLPNSVYAAHDYSVAGVFRSNGYPAVSEGRFVDRHQLEQTFLERTRYMRETGTPIWIGEFGPVYGGTQYTGDPAHDVAVDEQRLQLVSDQIDIYAEHGASWHLWTYKDVGLHGLVRLDPESSYLQRIAPVLAKKARLAVDAWGTSDAQVRHVMAPLERLLDEEFPDFDPYPWGARRWVEDAVLHGVIAEAMVGDFAKAFAGITADEAASVARSWELQQCSPRDSLVRVLRRHLLETAER